ncbi:MAG: tetratricopeptide repeat protein, partial [Parachlamydiaceae bacterium]
RIETWLKWGQLLLEYGKHYESLEMIESSIRKFEMANSLEARNPMVLCFWAEALVIYGTQTDSIDSFKRAEELFAVSVAICPESDLSWHLYGCCYNELGRYFGTTYYYKQAIEKFQLGLGVNKNSPLLWHGIAFSYFAIGELTGDIALIEKSCQYCVKAMECGAFSQPQCWNDWGVALMKLGEMTQDKSYGLAALEKFENALNIQSSWGSTEESDPELLYNFGCALDFIGDFSDDPSYYEKAIQTLQKVLQLQPDHPHATYNLALALAHLGEFISDVECLERAIQYFEEIIQKDPEDEMAWNECGLTYMNLAQMVYDAAIPHKSQCHYDRAESMFRKAVALGYAHAYYNLACHASLMGNCHLGMFYLEKAAAYGGLPPLKEIMQDDWLALLRQTPDFQAFISAYKSKDSAH